MLPYVICSVFPSSPVRSLEEAANWKTPLGSSLGRILIVALVDVTSTASPVVEVSSTTRLSVSSGIASSFTARVIVVSFCPSTRVTRPEVGIIVTSSAEADVYVTWKDTSASPVQSMKLCAKHFSKNDCLTVYQCQMKQ